MFLQLSCGNPMSKRQQPMKKQHGLSCFAPARGFGRWIFAATVNSESSKKPSEKRNATQRGTKCNPRETKGNPGGTERKRLPATCVLLLGNSKNKVCLEETKFVLTGRMLSSKNVCFCNACALRKKSIYTTHHFAFVQQAGLQHTYQSARHPRAQISYVQLYN